MAVARRSSSPAAMARAQVAQPRVGPNAVIQLAHALRARLGERLARAVFARAGLERMLDQPPTAMVDEREASALFAALFEVLNADEAAAVAAEAGGRTAEYVLAHRIPWPARALLRALPSRPSALLLLAAIRRNAWTFAGSGRFVARAGPPIVIEIARNPLLMDEGVWHVAVFERLFRTLVSPHAVVRYAYRCDAGVPSCSFEISFAPAPAGRQSTRDA